MSPPWTAAVDVGFQNRPPRSSGHPFYGQLNRVLDATGFDAVVESQSSMTLVLLERGATRHRRRAVRRAAGWLTGASVVDRGRTACCEAVERVRNLYDHVSQHGARSRVTACVLCKQQDRPPFRRTRITLCPEEVTVQSRMRKENRSMRHVRVVGRDVHAATIAIAVAESAGEVRSLGTIANRLASVRRPVATSAAARQASTRRSPRSPAASPTSRRQHVERIFYFFLGSRTWLSTSENVTRPHVCVPFSTLCSSGVHT